MAVTINDIAKKAGVSQTTVSRVLNKSGYVKESTRVKIEAAIKETNYIPSAIARSLSKSESNTIGVILPDITNIYFAQLIKGISEVVEKNNLNIIFFNSDNVLSKEVRALKILKEQRIKGIIMTPGFGEEINNRDYIDIIKSFNIPIVLASADLKFTKLSGIFVDNVKGGFIATEKLIKEGHRNIAIITGMLESEPVADRITGYKKALKKYNIKINDNYILNGKFDMDTSYKLTKGIIKNNKEVTAVIVCSNRMTMGVIKCLRDNKLNIGIDIAVTAFDRMNVLEMFGVDITYIDECPLELGKKSAKLLCDIFKGNIIDTKRIILEPVVVSN